MDYDKAIGNAIDWEIRNWQERQIDAINQEAFPLLSADDDELLKTLAGLNTAWGATKVLLPPVAGMAAPATIPLYLLGKAQDALEGAYKKYLDDVNTRITERYTNVRDKLINEIQSVARIFKGTPDGVKLIKSIREGVPSWEDVNSDQKLEIYYRELLNQSGIIVSDPAIIRKQTKEGFGKLLQNLKDVYLATYHGPCWGEAGNRYLYYSDSGGTLPIRANTLGLGNRAEWRKFRAKGAKSYGGGWVMFKGFESLRAAQCSQWDHRKPQREFQDSILRRIWQMKVLVKPSPQYRFKGVWVSRHAQSDTAQPPAFSPPTTMTLNSGARRAHEVLKQRGVL